MFDTLLIVTLFLLASLLVCLLTLRLSINIKHLCHLYHSLPMLTDFLKFRPPTPPPLFILTPTPTPFMGHLRVLVYFNGRKFYGKKFSLFRRWKTEFAKRYSAKIKFYIGSTKINSRKKTFQPFRKNNISTRRIIFPQKLLLLLLSISFKVDFIQCLRNFFWLFYRQI